MAKPTRYTAEMFNEYFSKGLWTNDTTSDLWEENAKRHPHKEAFVDLKRRVSWSQLKVMSDRLAFNLLKLGLERDDFLFAFLPNHVESYIIRIACEKAGILCGTALMTIRETEIEHILKKFDAIATAIPIKFREFNYLKAIEEMRPRLPRLKHLLVTGDEIPSGTLSIEKMMNDPTRQTIPDSCFDITKFKATEVSIIGFTSGTTGIPKGAEHAQCARMAMARAYGGGPKINEKDIVLNIISPVGGLSSAFCYNGSAALVGAKVVLLDIWSPEKTFELIEKEKVTILLAVPAQLAKIISDPSMDRYLLSSLRCICTSTAPLPYSLARNLEEKLKVPIVNFYGQLDGGVISRTNIDDPHEVRRGTVGKPLKENMISLVDDKGMEVPKGKEGEIIYTGPSASSGYFKDLNSTLEVWGSLGSNGRCRSGDLGRLDENGNLILVGRKKDVIIRGGQNIYPAEIEGFLLTHPRIESAAVIPMPDPIMGEKACAYITCKPGETITFEEMKAYLKNKKIAPYKIPERLEIREKLPLKGNQKIDKISLKEDIIERLKSEGKFHVQ